MNELLYLVSCRYDIILRPSCCSSLECHWWQTVVLLQDVSEQQARLSAELEQCKAAVLELTNENVLLEKRATEMTVQLSAKNLETVALEASKTKLEADVQDLHGRICLAQTHSESHQAVQVRTPCLFFYFMICYSFSP